MLDASAMAKAVGQWTGMLPTIPAEQADAHRLQCMEVWGGNQGVRTAVELAGLDVWVESQPFENAQEGGDIHYVSTCGSGRVSRLVVADVSGHGSHVSSLATRLRDLMRKHVNVMNMSAFARELNREFVTLGSAGRFATAVLVTYFAPQDTLLVCNAGHPRPLWYHAAARQWTFLDAQSPERVEQVAGASNLPLGIIDDTSYAQFAVPLEPGDVVVIYTDCLIETCNAAGAELSERGLLALAEGIDVASAQSVAAGLIEGVAGHRGDGPVCDDLTLVVLRHNATEPPAMTRAWSAITEASRLLGLIDYK